jgi:possible transcriptional regulator
MNNIARIIKALMEIHNLTQVDFAVKSDVPLPTVRKYLRSEFNPTKKNIEKIEKHFELELKKILEINFDNLDEIEEVEFFYKKRLEKENAIYQELYQLENLMIDNYNGINSQYEKDNGTNFFEDLLIAGDEVEKLKNTLELLKKLSSDNKNFLKKDNQLLEKPNKKNFDDFKTSDKILIDLLKCLDFDIQVIKNTRKFIIKKENSTYKMDSMLFENILMLLKKDVSDNFLKYLKILDIEIKDTD